MSKRKKGGSFFKRLLAVMLICFCLFYVGYAVGVVPESWVTTLETAFNGGKPVEASGSRRISDFVHDLIQKNFGAKKDVFGHPSSSPSSSSPLPAVSVPAFSLPSSTVSDDSTLTVEFIDVGQADCTLIYTGEHAMLIDAGNIGDGPLVASYIHSLGINDFDYIIGTHAHEDHIGGLDKIIDGFDADYIMLPNTSSTPNGAFSYVKRAADSANASLLSPAVGQSYSLGDAVWTVLSCDYAEDSTNENEYSIVIYLQYGDSSFLFAGDAEEPNERVMMKSFTDLSADVLRVGHHGSRTSTSQAFYDAVTPSYAVISVGTDNEYGHPTKSVIERLKASETLRTDILGTIVITSDGGNLEVSNKTTNTDTGQ